MLEAKADMVVAGTFVSVGIHGPAICGALRLDGVAAFDAAAGAQVSVIGEGVVPVTARTAITAGVEVEVGASGKAITLASGKAVGRALTTAANNADVYVRLY